MALLNSLTAWQPLIENLTFLSSSGVFSRAVSPVSFNQQSEMYLYLSNSNISPPSFPLILIFVPHHPVASFEEPGEGLGVQPAEVVRRRVDGLVVRLEEHCKDSSIS